MIISFQLAVEANELLDEPVELDKSCFGGKRKGKRGRGSAGKVVVFGILKRQDKVYTLVAEHLQTETLLPVIEKKIRPDSVVYTDCLSSYDVLDASEFRHVRINHSERFAERKNHINGIENFWNQVKRVLRKYNGIVRKSVGLSLKECEFRGNHGSPSRQLKTLSSWRQI